jgi:predicted dehydrogenase
MSEHPVGVGIVGSGFGTLVAAPAFASVDVASVTAVCSRQIERARTASDELGASFATDSVDALCARADVDLVFVATPPHLHRDVVLTALDAGKHVVCEKPFGLSPLDALVMLERAVARDRLHFLDFEFRTEPARQSLSTAIADGLLGDVRHVTITAMVAGGRFPVMNRDGWWQRRELGGGWLGAMGSHYLDAIRVWFGEIVSVSALLETRRTHLEGDADAAPITADDGFVARITTETGVVCVLDTASSIGVDIGPRVGVYGTAATAVLEREHVLTIIDDSGNIEQHDFSPIDAGPRHPSRSALGVWAAQIVDAVHTGHQLAPNFLDGLRVQEVIAAAHRSHELGGADVVVVRNAAPI